MITQVCANVRNYFIRDNDDIILGDFVIAGGELSPSANIDIYDGQYFRIVGSKFNDGVHQFPCYDLTDEEFNGAVWAMFVPPAFISLVAEIEEYCNSDAGKANAYVSESFGGYSYTKAKDAYGNPLSWQGVFKSRLNAWRKI